jgi:hypothetical protein
MGAAAFDIFQPALNGSIVEIAIWGGKLVGLVALDPPYQGALDGSNHFNSSGG